MGKKVTKMRLKKSQAHEVAQLRLREALGEQYACCVLITCSRPSKEGNMEVELSFEGEESLAAFLIDNASQVFDDRLQEETQ
ncbi:MAG: hypothetical protein RL235_273 [Chlamydiota bacterium]|jgi:hypothetical protein